MAMEERERKLIIVLGIGAVVYGIYAGFIMEGSLLDRYSKSAKEIEELMDKLNETRREAKRLPELQQEKADLEAQLKLIEKKLPKEGQLELIIKQIPAMAEAVGLKSNPPEYEFTLSDDLKMHDYYNEQIVKFKTSAITWTELIKLIHSIYNFERLIDLSTLNIELLPESGEFSMDCKIVLFIFKE